MVQKLAPFFEDEEESANIGVRHNSARVDTVAVSSRSARTPVDRLVSFTHSSRKMYGGYDGSASQFAGQGGFLPTPAGGATAGTDAAAGGAVSVDGRAREPGRSRKASHIIPLASPRGRAERRRLLTRPRREIQLAFQNLGTPT